MVVSFNLMLGVYVDFNVINLMYDFMVVGNCY